MDYYFRFGRQDDPEHPKPVIKNIVDRYHHAYIIGKTGMGKSSLMESMAAYDIEYGCAVIFIDPKGDSVKKLYALHKDKDPLYISIDNPIVINPIDKPEYHVDEIISEFQKIMDVLIALTTPINPPASIWMKEVIENTIRIIDKPENKNIKWIANFLQYDKVRKDFASTITDKDLRDYWTDFDKPEAGGRYPKWKDKILAAQRMASRLNEVSHGRMEKFVIGSNQFDVAKIITEGRIVFVDTSRMSMNARIYVSNLIVYSVLAFIEFSKVKPKPLMVYVDEFQLVVSDWFADLLARCRYKLIGFTLAHQSFAQIPKNILQTILETVHAMICFRTGDEVAMRLSHYFDVKPIDLFNLKKHFAWVRLGTDNTLTHIYKPLEVELIDTPTFKPSKETEELLDFLGDDLV